MIEIIQIIITKMIIPFILSSLLFLMIIIILEGIKVNIERHRK